MPNDREIAAVLAVAGAKRYEYFIKRVADRRQVWGLKNKQGWVTAGTQDGQISLPVWPYSEYASLCATDIWSDCLPSAITLEDWLTKWLPGLSEDSMLVAVFPVPSGKGGPIVAPKKLKRDLEDYIEEWFGD